MSDDSEREQDIDRIKRALFDLRQKPFSFGRTIAPVRSMAGRSQI